MPIRILVTAALLLGASLAQAQALDPFAPPAERFDAEKLPAYKLILVGDSTAAPHSGWGGAFCAHHVKWEVSCVNLARSARSTRSYRSEGSWDLALAEMKVRGYERIVVLIQMGHNDQARHKGERWTELASEFPENLRRFVREARTAGALPVLVTPLSRREFREGRLDNTLAPWSEQVRKVARELRVPLVDLNARSAELVQSLGPVAAMKFAQRAPTGEEHDAAAKGTTLPAPPPPPKAEEPEKPPAPGARGSVTLKFDYTHLGWDGARVFAAMVAEDLGTAVPELAGLLVP
ncbi:MAG TPA: rhamnogalacturonan acetylesterase [Verrucomicrobiae bacterium]|nr:rhamnogalacturonan acetylesterase [Verrucomicrobiae bacterium]